MRIYQVLGGTLVIGIAESYGPVIREVLGHLGDFPDDAFGNP